MQKAKQPPIVKLFAYSIIFTLFSVVILVLSLVWAGIAFLWSIPQ